MPARSRPAAAVVGLACLGLAAGCGTSAPTYVPGVTGTLVLNGSPYKLAKGERVILLLQEPRALMMVEVPVGQDGTFKMPDGGVPAATYTADVLVFGRPAGSPLFPGRDAPNPGAPVAATLKQKVEVKPGGGPLQLDLGQFD